MKFTKPQFAALGRAARRERGNFCPIPGVHAAAETALIDALDRRGLVEWDGPSPRISEAGKDAYDAELARRLDQLPSTMNGANI